jgi:curved DNA-binding protein CbpA
LDPKGRAYAQLGLAPGASPARLREQYLSLVRRWHPDRFANDPQGQAEAAARMREINAAYRLLAKASASASTHHDGSKPPPPRRGERLTREEIERLVQSLGTEGPVETAFAVLRSVSLVVGITLGALALLGLGFRLSVALYRGEPAAVLREPRLATHPVLVGGALLACWEWRRRGGKASS